MQALELPLNFSLEVTPKLNSPIKDIPSQLSTHVLNPLNSLENALKSIIPQNSEENTVIRTRKILGEGAKMLSDEQIQCVITEFQFLINAWLDEYEQEVFSGMTLKEVLNEK